jgi:hypothetical protein
VIRDTRSCTSAYQPMPERGYVGCMVSPWARLLSIR